MALPGRRDGGDARASAGARSPRRRPPPSVGRLDPARLREPHRPPADRPRPPPAGRADRERRTQQRRQGIPARLFEPPGRDGRRLRRGTLHVAAKGRRSSRGSAAASALPRSRRGRARSSCWPAIRSPRSETFVLHWSSSRSSASAGISLRSPRSWPRRCTLKVGSRRRSPPPSRARKHRRLTMSTRRFRGGSRARRRSPSSGAAGRRKRSARPPSRRRHH